MLKIWSMKQQQQKDEAAQGPQKKKKVTAAQLRVQRDLNELSLGNTMRIDFPNPDDILNFNLTIEPDEGMYKGGSFTFTFAINQSFPHDPPKVKCTSKIYHPNIDLEGNVCLNILREDWKPVLNLNAVIVGMQFLFLEPNASDPLNKEAAEDLRNNRENFKRNARTAMGGGTEWEVMMADPRYFQYPSMTAWREEEEERMGYTGAFKGIIQATGVLCTLFVSFLCIYATSQRLRKDA